MTKQELYTVRDLRKKIRDAENFLELLRCRVSNLTPQLDGLPHAQPLESRVEKVVLMILEADREVEAYRQQLLMEAATLTNKICRLVPDTQERAVMLMRYVSCLRFEEIMKTLHMSDGTVFRLHRKGLAKLKVS